MKIIDRGIIFENSMPHLKSRQAYFPSIIKTGENELMASYVVGEAFESVNQTTEISISNDLGKTWEHKGKILDKSKIDNPISDYLKLTLVKDRLCAFGYAYDRTNPNLPIGNLETGGLLDSVMYYIESKDKGKTWTKPMLVKNSFNDPVEASSPILVLANGHFVTPIANFYNWEGKCSNGLYGRLLRSEDEGKTWNDNTTIMEFEGRNTTAWEQRVCQLESGNVVVIAWCEDLKNNKTLPNQYALSKDYGKTFCLPQSTSIMGQASYVTHIGDNRVLALHCMRKNTKRPGIYAYIVDLAKDTWNILDEKVIWEPTIPTMKADKHLMDVFAYLKFGQPSAIKINDNEYILVNWCVEEGQGKISWTNFQI